MGLVRKAVEPLLLKMCRNRSEKNKSGKSRSIYFTWGKGDGKEYPSSSNRPSAAIVCMYWVCDLYASSIFKKIGPVRDSYRYSIWMLLSPGG